MMRVYARNVWLWDDRVVETWMDHPLGPCACSQLRRTSRAISALYDRFLAPAGLTVTQYAILVNIARREDAGISRTALALQLGMDRTTLTRNLRPLEREKLVDGSAGEEDRRASILRLTAPGKRRLNKAFGLWAKVQREFAQSFGDGPLADLRRLLENAAAAAGEVRGKEVKTR